MLELAAGTGQWTGLLAELADELLVTDASPEMLELNRARVGERPHVRYHVADALALRASRTYDVVFFGFFLSHVPPVSSTPSGPASPGSWRPAAASSSSTRPITACGRRTGSTATAGIVRRPLTDGRVHRAVKVLWRPDQLERRLSEIGWDASVREERPFYWGTAARR